MAERELAIVIRAKDLASKAIAGVNRNLSKIGSQAQRGLSNAASNIGRGIQVAGAAAVGGLVYSLKVAGDFEAQMNTLNTIARTTGDAFTGELGAIGDGLRKMARDTGTPLEELTTAYYDLLSAGIKTADSQNVLTAANTLAIGGLASTAETIDLLTTAINSYGGDASKAGEYADQFAVAIERGKVTAAEIAAGFAQVGPMAASMNVGIDETSAILGQLTAKGVPAAEVFTQMRAAMVALQRQTPEMKQVLDELGISNVEAEVASRGLVPVWDDLRRKADELGIPLIKLTGRVEGTMFALGTTGDAFETFEENLEAVRKGTGTAQEQMAERQQGLNHQMNRMKAILNDVAITLGSKLLPKVVPLLQRLAEWIEANQSRISAWADEVAEGFESAVKWAASLDWNAIANSLKMAADFSRGLVEAFLGMPDWVKQAVITGWGLNKLTGGALGGILGSVASGLIKGVLGINAGVVNVNAATANMGPGGAGGKGGGGGILGNILKWVIGPAAAAGAGAYIGNELIEPGIAPARDYQRGQFEAVLASGDAEAISSGLRAIDDQLDVVGSGLTNDLPEQIALALDIGGVRTALEEQRAALEAELARIWETSERGAAAARDAVPWAQRNAEETHRLNMSEANRFAVKQASDRYNANAQIAKQHEALTAVRSQGGVLAQIRDKKSSVSVNVQNHTSTHVTIDGREVVSLAYLRTQTNADSPELRGFI